MCTLAFFQDRAGTTPAKAANYATRTEAGVMGAGGGLPKPPLTSPTTQRTACCAVLALDLYATPLPLPSGGVSELDAPTRHRLQPGRKPIVTRNHLRIRNRH